MLCRNFLNNARSVLILEHIDFSLELRSLWQKIIFPPGLRFGLFGGLLLSLILGFRYKNSSHRINMGFFLFRDFDPQKIFSHMELYLVIFFIFFLKIFGAI